MKLELRPHQKSAIVNLRQSWKKHRTHVLEAPTGAGKTAIASHVVNGFASKGMRVLFIAPYTILVEQTAQKFVEYGLEEPSIIWRDHPAYDPYKRIQIASADTLIRREIPEHDVMIVDEAHLRRKTLLEYIDDSDKPVIGLTATPFAKWMGKHYENLVKTTTMRQLINDGYLSDYDIYAPTKPDLTGVKTTAGAYGPDYSETDLEEVMNGAQLVGDIVSNWLENGDNEPTIAFCVNVAHANHVCIEFGKAGVQAEVMTAKTKPEERQRIIWRFEQGITKIICNVGVLVAGFDSDVRCIIFARPTKSEIRWLQCLGRGLRTAKGKEICKIFDHSGTVLALGFPEDIQYSHLLTGADPKSSSSIYEEEKTEKKPKECPKCHFMKDAGVYICPKCGFKPMVGEDVEVDETRGLQSIKGKKKQYSKEAKQQFYSELWGYWKQKQAEGKNWKRGWVANKYREKFGVWPKGLSEFPKSPSPDMVNWVTYTNIKKAKSRGNR